jgi:Tfp pilus assembly protein PilZ
VLNDDRAVFVVAFDDDAASGIREAAAAVGVPSALIGRCDDVSVALEDTTPLAIVLRIDAEGASRAFAHLRSQGRLAQVPIFGVAPERSDLAFTELFVWGGDDLVAAALEPMARRLRALRAPARSEAPVRQDRAVIAGSDPAWRTVMGRALYNGGFQVRFAVNAAGLAEECSTQGGVRVVVAADDLAPSGALDALTSARARNSPEAWVLVAPPKRMAGVHAAVKSVGRAAVVDGYAPPENVLFVVNELLAARGVDKRATPRLLYGTAVAFRLAGRDEDEIGFSYNVNAGGLYVRTLSPIDAGQELWLEMWPPRSERRVRLAGKVAWGRPFGPVGGATVPAGFGVQLTDGLAGDLDRWRSGYAAYAESLIGRPAPA